MSSPKKSSRNTKLVLTISIVILLLLVVIAIGNSIPNSQISAQLAGQQCPKGEIKETFGSRGTLSQTCNPLTINPAVAWPEGEGTAPVRGRRLLDQVAKRDARKAAIADAENKTITLCNSQKNDLSFSNTCENLPANTRGPLGCKAVSTRDSSGKTVSGARCLATNCRITQNPRRIDSAQGRLWEAKAKCEGQIAQPCGPAGNPQADLHNQLTGLCKTRVTKDMRECPDRGGSNCQNNLGPLGALDKMRFTNTSDRAAANQARTASYSGICNGILSCKEM